MILILAAIYGVLIALVVKVDAAWWLMALLALPTLPALFDILKDTSAGLRLSQDRLEWYTGKRQGALELSEIEHMQFDTRWDFSVRVTAFLIGNKKVRLPYEAIPPHRTFEVALQDRGLTVKRNHFTVF
ncbi:hypothetical protein [Sedimentitalea todarodis]|uniref:YcxB-like protein domain-containing protein n=1 Tax=Sedimentitalea todarodis TaxID=1631240 RepID=A0ABU3V8U9_9RHOB|nr:hypothetical protein [Sedimentitalea todarodis]MDU9002606.1 hypothetical protein [Sedimentitalea todarodis]